MTHSPLGNHSLENAFEHLDAETLELLDPHTYWFVGPGWVSRLVAAGGEPFWIPTAFEPADQSRVSILPPRRWGFLLGSTLLPSTMFVECEEDAVNMLLEALNHEEGYLSGSAPSKLVPPGFIR